MQKKLESYKNVSLLGDSSPEHCNFLKESSADLGEPSTSLHIDLTGQKSSQKPADGSELIEFEKLKQQLAEAREKLKQLSEIESFAKRKLVFDDGKSS